MLRTGHGNLVCWYIQRSLNAQELRLPANGIGNERQPSRATLLQNTSLSI